MVNTATGTGTVASSPLVVPEKSPALTKLTLVKEMVGIHYSDTKWDCALQGIIWAVSAQVQASCCRVFRRGTVTEFHESSHQAPTNFGSLMRFENPDYIWVERPPIDEAATLSIRYSFDRNWDESIDLVKDQDFFIETVEGSQSQSQVIRVFPNENLRLNLTNVPLSSISFFAVVPHVMGYRVEYTGGFPEIPSGTGVDDSYIDVPVGLQYWVATKVARVFKSRMEESPMLTDDEIKALKPYWRRGRYLGG